MKQVIKTMAVVWLLCLIPIRNASAQPRSVQELDAIANSVLKISGARSVNPMMTSMPSSQVLGKEMSATGEAFYVYAPLVGNCNRFVIVSGDKRLPSVLGYSDESRFDADNLPEGLRWFLEKCRADLALLNAQPSDGIVEECTRAAAVSPISPLLGGRVWDQGVPFNNQCPEVSPGIRAVTGCTATAMAQIMAYHQHPQKATGSIVYNTGSYGYAVSADLDNAPAYAWTDMIDSYEGAYSDAQAEAVAQLMFHAGAAIATDFCEISSAAGTNSPEKAFVSHFGYDDGIRIVRRSDCSDDEWNALLQQELASGRPVLVSGQDTGGYGGHAFVFDGVDAAGNYHVNWGWSGMCDGYYNVYDLTPEEIGIGGGNGSYNYDCQAIVGIRPEDGVSETEPTNIVAGAIKLDTGIGTFDLSQSLSLKVRYFTNMRYLDFNGDLQMLLDDGNGNVVTLGAPLGLRSSIPQGYSIWSDDEGYLPALTATLPADIAEGTYRLYVGVKQDGYTQWGSIKTPLAEFPDCYDYYELTVADDQYTVDRVAHLHTPDESGVCSSCGKSLELVINDHDVECPDFDAPYDTYARVTYNRELDNGYTYGIITLPFAPDAESLANFRFYKLCRTQADAITFEEEVAPVANTPYLYSIRKGAATTSSITGGVTTVSTDVINASVGTWEFVGSLANSVVDCTADPTTANYLFNPVSNKLHKVTKKLTVYPYSGYLRNRITAQTSTTSLRVFISGPTGIKEISRSEVEGLGQGLFDLQGRMLTHPVKGQIYIENGVKKMNNK